MLSCREFARLSVATIFKSYPALVQHHLALAVAAFLLSDERMKRFVVNWSEKAFARGTATPRVRGSPIFADVENFASYLEGMMAMSGWTEEVVKAGTWHWPKQ